MFENYDWLAANLHKKHIIIRKQLLLEETLFPLMYLFTEYNIYISWPIHFQEWLTSFFSFMMGYRPELLSFLNLKVIYGFTAKNDFLTMFWARTNILVNLQWKFCSLWISLNRFEPGQKCFVQFGELASIFMYLPQITLLSALWKGIDLTVHYKTAWITK